MSTEDQATPPAAPASPDVPLVGNAALVERLGTVAAALKFGTVYEFTRVGAAPKLNPAKAIIPHSWASESVLSNPKLKAARAATPLVKTFPLTDRAESKYTVDLPIGVTVLLGKSGKGKTRFAFDHLFTSAQSRGEKPLYIKMHEPGDEEKMIAVAKDGNLSIPEFELFLANTLGQALFDHSHDFIVIDSLRYLFYSSSGGATGKGGVNMSLFMDLTHLDVLATRLRQRLVVVINPMTDDDAAFDFYVEAAVGAVAGVIVMSSSTSARSTTRYAQTREMIEMHVPKQSANDRLVGRPVQSGPQSVGSTNSGAVAVNSTIFGRNKGVK